MSFASPGVTIKEVDLTATINVSDQNVALIVIAAETGPVDTVTYISSEKELVEIFGKPNEYNFESWYAAQTTIQYGGIAAVIRPSSSSVVLKSAYSASGVLNDFIIKNQFDYENYTGNSFYFAGRNAGSKYNSVKVVAIDHGADQILSVSGATQNNTTLNVASSSGFAGGDYVKIADEYFLVSSTSTGTLTVAGAQLGTAGAGTVPYAAGSTVTKWSFSESGTSSTLAETNATPELTASETFITVASVTGFAINDYVKIKRVPTGGASPVTTFEYAKVTGVDSDTNTLQVVRGQLGSTAISFDDDPTAPETAVTVSVIKMTFAATTPITTLSAAYPSYTIGTFSGAVGGIVKSGAGANAKTGWVHNIVNGAVNVILSNSTVRFAAGETLYNADGTSAIGSITAVANYYDTLEYAPGQKWIDIAAQPGTSAGVAAKGGKFDEMHILVLDEEGTISGVVNTVLERFTFVSKAKDSSNLDGTVPYFHSTLLGKSSYVYPGSGSGVDFIGTGTTNRVLLEGGGFTSTDTSIGLANSTNKYYPILSVSNLPSISFSLGGGTDYDFANYLTDIEAAVTNGYELVRDSETFNDIDFLIPGKISTSRALKLIDIAEYRKDCMAVISPRRSDIINSNSSTQKTTDIIDFYNGIPSSSYAIFDSGYKYIYDKFNDVYRYVPCAADVAGLCINTTINSETWFSPAGYNRGNLKNATKLAYSPKQSERDRLYSARINPIVSFPGQGIVLFGDKTGLASPSAFNRINVRRLFIELEKNVARFSKFQLFEINDEITRSSFKAAVEPYLRNVQGRRGIYDFLVVCDETNNTPDVIDANEFYAEIFIKPARSINFITITFIATRTGVSFAELTT